MTARLLRWTLLALIANASHHVVAFQNPTTATPKLEMVADGLDYPCAVTLHPELRWPIVANSGAGNILAMVDGQTIVLIDGFAVEALEQNRSGMFGPASLTTIKTSRDKNLLVVGTAGEETGSDYVSAFSLSGNDAVSIGKTTDAESELFGRTLNRSGEHPALGDFFGIASFDEYVWFTTSGDDSTSWIGEFQLTDGVAGKCKRFFKTATSEEQSRSTAIALGPDGMIAVASRAVTENSGPAQLRFFEIDNGNPRASFDLELEEVVAIAWSPVSGGLFVLNNSTSDLGKSGLYSLVASNYNRQCRADFLINIANPSAMCFRDDGKLWVTSFGEKPAMGAGALQLISQFESVEGADDRPND